jgi:hypothetical protein
VNLVIKLSKTVEAAKNAAAAAAINESRMKLLKMASKNEMLTVYYPLVLVGLLFVITL